MSGLNSLLQQMANPGSGTLQGVPGLGSVDLSPIENIPSGLGVIDSFRQGRADHAARGEQAVQAEQTQRENARSNFTKDDEARLQSNVQVALEMEAAPQENWGGLVDQRLSEREEAGLDTTDLSEMKSILDDGDFAEANEMVQAVLVMGSKAGLIKETPDEQQARKIAFEEAKAEAEATSGTTSKVQRSETVQLDDGTLLNIQTPRAGGAPEVHKVEGFTDPDTGEVTEFAKETPADKRVAELANLKQELQLKSDTAFQEALSAGDAQDMASAKADIIPASNALSAAKRLKTLLEKGIETGGVPGTVLNLLEKWSGIRAPDKAEAERLMKEQALELLANFPGQISEGERAFVVDMETNFGITAEGNLRLVDRAIELINVRLEKGEAAVQGREAFDTFVQTTLNKALGRGVTAKDVVSQIGETEIARIAKEENITRDEAIELLREELNAEAQQ